MIDQSTGWKPPRAGRGRNHRSMASKYRPNGRGRAASCSHVECKLEVSSFVLHKGQEGNRVPSRSQRSTHSVGGGAARQKGVGSVRDSAFIRPQALVRRASEACVLRSRGLHSRTDVEVMVARQQAQLVAIAQVLVANGAHGLVRDAVERGHELVLFDDAAQWDLARKQPRA